MKFKIPNGDLSSKVVWGVRWEKGVSEDIADSYLCARLMAHGYIPVEEEVAEKPKRKKKAK